MSLYGSDYWTTTNYRIHLISTDDILPHEHIDPDQASKVVAMIAQANMWTHPIALEQSRLIVMDGHHRLQAAKLLGIHFVPAVLSSYNSGIVTLSSWCGTSISVEDIFTAAVKCTLLPVKTTRHIFNPHIGVSNVPLEHLKKVNLEIKL